VVVSDDVMVIGDPGRNGNRGAVYVFARSGTVWSQKTKLSVDDSAHADEFGWQVDKGDEFILVGAPAKDSGTGEVYVFAQNADGLIEERQLGRLVTPNN
jgi:hypothetical protein